MLLKHAQILKNMILTGIFFAFTISNLRKLSLLLSHFPPLSVYSKHWQLMEEVLNSRITWVTKVTGTFRGKSIIETVASSRDIGQENRPLACHICRRWGKKVNFSPDLLQTWSFVFFTKYPIANKNTQHECCFYEEYEYLLLNSVKNIYFSHEIGCVQFGPN